MSTLVAHEKSESASRGKLEEPISGMVQLRGVQPVPVPQLYRPEVDLSAVDPYTLKRKIDFRLLPWLTLLYLMDFLDRGSIGNARVCTLCICTPLAFPNAIFNPLAV